MRYVTAQDVLVIHARVIDATGGLHGVRDIGLLASAVARPATAGFGKEMFPGLFQKAAVYVESFVQYHCFLDGNKRTAMAVCARFLFLNGYQLTATQKAFVAFALGAANKKYSLDEMASWIKRHAKR